MQDYGAGFPSYFALKLRKELYTLFREMTEIRIFASFDTNWDDATSQRIGKMLNFLTKQGIQVDIISDFTLRRQQLQDANTKLYDMALIFFSDAYESKCKVDLDSVRLYLREPIFLGLNLEKDSPNGWLKDDVLDDALWISYNASDIFEVAADEVLKQVRLLLKLAIVAPSIASLEQVGDAWPLNLSSAIGNNMTPYNENAILDALKYICQNDCTTSIAVVGGDNSAISTAMRDYIERNRMALIEQCNIRYVARLEMRRLITKIDQQEGETAGELLEKARRAMQSNVADFACLMLENIVIVQSPEGAAEFERRKNAAKSDDLSKLGHVIDAKLGNNRLLVVIDGMVDNLSALLCIGELNSKVIRCIVTVNDAKLLRKGNGRYIYKIINL